MDAEEALAAKHAVKAFSLRELGQGKPRGGGAAGAKARHQVLDRLARLGQGLSPAQRNEFGWFTEAWDGKMLAEHGDDWAALFASWVQRLVDEHGAGRGAAFSAFVHSETQRCFADEVAIVLPG